jgi:hypothetical protein
MYEEIIKIYENYKNPIINKEAFTIEEYYHDSGYNFLAEYFSFIEFSELLLLIIIVRFLFSWRMYIFIYLVYILFQIYFSLYFVNSNYKNKNEITLSLVDKFEIILSSLVIPFGNIIRVKLKKEHILKAGGGGLFITTSVVTTIKKPDTLDFTNFAKYYMQTERHPKIPTNLVTSYTDAFGKFKFDKSISLFKECNINQEKFLMNLSKKFFLTQQDLIKQDKVFDNDLNLAMHKLYLGETNKIILIKAQENFNVDFLIPTDKYDDLISLDSSQPLVSKPWTSSDLLVKEYARNNSKLTELLDAGQTQGNQKILKGLASVREKGTQADYYCFNMSGRVESTRSRYTRDEISAEYNLPKDAISAVDITRKNFNNPENIITSLINDKIIPFNDHCMSFPQTHHEVAVVLPATITNEEKEFIDQAINKFIEEKNNEVLNSISARIPKLSYKSVIDTFLN